LSTTTKNLGLFKPDLTDAADITAMNENWEKIDEQLGDLSTDSIIEQNKDEEQRFWVGAKKEFDAIPVKDPNTQYTVLDETTNDPVEDSTNPGCYYRMVGENQEWLNPPMSNAIPASTTAPASIPENCEYRTMQRWMGKPVYTALVAFGGISSSGITQKFYYPDGIIKRVLRIEGSLNDGRNIPLETDSVNGTLGIALGVQGNKIGFTVKSGTYSDREAVIQVWYVKD
jgi:hypothetical protein